MKKRIAILGFGNVGQTLLNSICDDADFGERFQVHSIWNRSASIFEAHEISKEIIIYKELEELIADLSNVDLVVECAHSNVLLNHGMDILRNANLFISSPTAFANEPFRRSIGSILASGSHKCYIPLGASVGVWDVIRLDQAGLIKSINVTMSKDPSAFKLKDQETIRKNRNAILQEGAVEIASGNIAEMNVIAPQNTNTMSVYAMAATHLGFEKCKGRLVANSELTSHIVTCEIETSAGLKYQMTRDNPADKGAVTGSATFGSFLNSLKNYNKGIQHGNFTFC